MVMNARRPGEGYQGQVRLQSPNGTEFVTIQVPGRASVAYYAQYPNRETGWGQVRGQARRQDMRFRRLLSEGWSVVPEPPAGSRGEEEKKRMSLVDGSTQTGDQSHGGQHASGEVEDSPNAYDRGKKWTGRGGRGGKRKPAERQNTPQAKKVRREERAAEVRVQDAGRRGGAGVYSPQPLRVSQEMLSSAEESAKLLAELVGRAALKVRRGISVHAEKLLVALETGDDPLPPLEWPAERPRARVLVTPDSSGSCQNWSGLGRAWALRLAAHQDLEVVYLENFNGQFRGFRELPEKFAALLAGIDVLVYLGDGDGYALCRSYSERGASLVVGISSDCAKVERVRLVPTGKQRFFWADRASRYSPNTWKEALRLALEQCQ